MSHDSCTNPEAGRFERLPDIFAARADDLETLAAQAYVWGLGPVWGARVRQRLTNPPDPWIQRAASSAGAPMNNLGHQSALSDPRLRVGVAPNVDTLYSLAWLDLADGPFVLETPDFGNRYYTFQFGTADTECHHCLGARTHGSRLPPLFIHGPGPTPPNPAGWESVASTTRYLLVAGRVLVDPRVPGDIERVHRLQSSMTLVPWRDYAAGRRDGPNDVPHQRLLVDPEAHVPEGLGPLHEVGSVLADWISGTQESALLDSFTAIGLRLGEGFVPGALTADERAAVATGIEMGRELVERGSRGFGASRNGWSVNLQGPNFGTDYLLRAVVAKDQVYVVPPEEALYPAASVDHDGEPLHGNAEYEITFRPDQLPPVDAFWSLTMYTRAGRLVPNRLNRYAVGDRSPDLASHPDGSLVVRVARHEPTDPSVNWLPAPAGPFRLLMRLYHPRPEVLSGSWTPPPVRRRTA